MNTPTLAGVVIAVLGLAACSSASTTKPTTTTLGADEVKAALNAQSLARSITDSFQAKGLTITFDQAHCMANNVLDEFGTDEIVQIALDVQAGRPSNPDVGDRGLRAVARCLPADVVAAMTNPNG
jgi:hypothetical protein